MWTRIDNASRRVLSLVALLIVGALSACGSQGAEPALSPSPSPPASPPTAVDVAALIDAVDCASGLDGINPRPSEFVVVRNGAPIAGETPAEPLPTMDAERIERSPLPQDAVAVAAVQCALVYATGEGYAGFVPRTFTGDLRTLTTTLRSANDPIPSVEGCPEVIDRAPNLWIVTADGELLAVAWPADACGHYTDPAPESVLSEQSLAPIDLQAVVPLS